MVGETIPLDLMPSSRGRLGITRRFPIGPVAGHQPLQLPAQPGRPQGRAGDRLGLLDRPQAALQGSARRCSRWPRSSTRRAAPAGAVSILPMTRALGDRLVADERFKLLTFTGSPSVGWDMKAARRQEEGRPGAGRQRRRDRGSRAPTSTGPSSASSWAPSPTPARSASASSGMFVHEAVWDEFLDRFVEGARHLRVGDPLDPETQLGPMVDAAAAQRTQRWVDEAVGARRPGAAGRPRRRRATSRRPSSSTRRCTAQVCSNEAFAPLVVAFPFNDFERRRAPGQRQRSTGSRRASSPMTWATPGRPSRSSRWAA